MTLHQLQRDFQYALIERNVSALQESTALTEGTELALSIYQHAYRVRLRDALRSHYPILEKYLGRMAFNAYVDGYISRYPSRSVSLTDYGDQLAADCLAHLNDVDVNTASELAAFEWLLGRAFGAAQGAPVTVAQLSAINPIHWAGLRFTPVPSVSRHTVTTSAVTIWRQLKMASTDTHSPPTAAPPITPETADTPTHWVIARVDLDVRFQSIPREEASALDRVLSGSPFAEVCEPLAAHHGEEAARVAATWLKRWIEAGWLELVS